MGGNQRPRGTCKLCLLDKWLCESHLIPKGIYPLLKSVRGGSYHGHPRSHDADVEADESLFAL